MKLFEFDIHIGDWRVLVQSRDIKNGAIQGRHIAPGAVTEDKIGDGEIKGRHIAPGAVTEDKIGDGEIKGRHIAPGAVTRDKISDGAIDDIYAVFKDLVNNYKPIVINGNVTNAPDEEDITSKNGLLKLKNRSSVLSNKGYVILRRGIPLSQQISLINTVYEVKYDFVLDSDLSIPEGCVLHFNGGSIDIGDYNITATSLENKFLSIKDFCADKVQCCAHIIESILAMCDCYIPKGIYTTKRAVVIDGLSNRVLFGDGLDVSILKDYGPDFYHNHLSIINESKNISIKGIGFVGSGRGYPETSLTYNGQYLVNISTPRDSEANYDIIENIVIESCGFSKASGGIYAYPGTVGLLVESCKFSDMLPTETIDAHGNHGIAGGYGVVCYFDHKNYNEETYKTGVKNITVSNCLFEETVQRHSFYIQNAYNGYFVNNKSYKNKDRSIVGYEFHIDLRLGKNNIFVNNYFEGGVGAVNSENGGLIDPQTGEPIAYCEDFTFENNTIVNTCKQRTNSGAVRIDASNRPRIINNNIHTKYNAPAIAIGGYCKDSLIAGNNISTGNIATPFTPLFGDSDSGTTDGAIVAYSFSKIERLTIQDNVIINEKVATSYGIHIRFVSELDNINIIGNYIKSSHTCFVVGGGSYTATIKNLIFEKNVFDAIPINIANIVAPEGNTDVILSDNSFLATNTFIPSASPYLSFVSNNNQYKLGTKYNEIGGCLALPSGRKVYNYEVSLFDFKLPAGVSYFSQGDLIINRGNTNSINYPVFFVCTLGGTPETVRFKPVWGKIQQEAFPNLNQFAGNKALDFAIGVRLFNIVDDRSAEWEGTRWIDNKGFSYARTHGGTGNRPTGTYKKLSDSVKPNPRSIFEGYTIEDTTDNKYYIASSIYFDSNLNDYVANWVEENTMQAPWSTAENPVYVNVPADAPRSGNTENRPSAEYSYNNLYVGFNYFDTDFGTYFYIKSVSRTMVGGEYQYSIEWCRRMYIHTILYSDRGYEYFDTNINCPIYAKYIDEETGAVIWIESDGVVAGTPRSGVFADKPTVADNLIPVGFKYFCTDKQTAEGQVNGIEIIHKGSDVWVDALGRIVE